MRGSEFAQLRAFAMVADQHSFSRAAERLGMSSSSVSEAVRELETRLGLQLLARTTRSVAPTEAGKRLLARLAPVLTELDAMLVDVGELRDTPSGTVRVVTPRIAFVDHLQPLLGDFAARYPDVVLDVTVNDGARELIASGYDVGIQLGEFLDKDVVAVPLSGPGRQLPVATPAYIAAHGAPTHPRELQTHRCINWRQHGATGLYRWEFERDGERLEVAVNGPLIVDDRELGIAAALQSVGIAMWGEHRVRPLIEAGRLVPLLEDWSPCFPGWFAYYPKQRHMPGAVRALIDALRARH